MRICVPYGTHWYPYFMRRLAERPANLFFFLRAGGRLTIASPEAHGINFPVSSIRGRDLRRHGSSTLSTNTVQRTTSKELR